MLSLLLVMVCLWLRDGFSYSKYYISTEAISVPLFFFYLLWNYYVIIYIKTHGFWLFHRLFWKSFESIFSLKQIMLFLIVPEHITYIIILGSGLFALPADQSSTRTLEPWLNMPFSIHDASFLNIYFTWNNSRITATITIIITSNLK